MELVKLCVDENIPVIPIPSPFAFVAALSASGLATDEFTFVGFLPKHAGSRKERLIVSAKEVATQIFYVLPHKLHQFIEEASSIFGGCRQCAIAREMTKIHEEAGCRLLEGSSHTRTASPSTYCGILWCSYGRACYKFGYSDRVHGEWLPQTSFAEKR